MADWDCTVEMSVGGIATFNTFQVTDVAGGGGPFANQAERLRDSWINSIMSTVTGETQLVSVIARSRDGSVEHESTSSQTGSLGGTALPVNCAFQFTKVSAIGRNGRMYIAGLPESVVSPTGLIDEASRSAAEGVCKLFLTDILTKDLQMIMDPFTVNSTGKNVVDAKVPKYIVTQRRRLARARG